jgi:hypothetical protein
MRYNARWTRENLENCIKDSKTYKEIIEKLGLKVGASSYNTLKTYLFKYNITFINDYTKKIWERDHLLDLIKKSINHTEVLIKMNLIPHGSNFKTLNKYIKKYDINVSHFDSYYKNEKKGYVEKSKLSDILVENSTFDRSTLKRRLYEDGLKQRVCEMCGQDEIWHGKCMSLIIDHINGVSDDNRIENLRIICPNCAATLSTHAGRNIKSKKPKCDCGNVITYKSKKCRVCHTRSTRKVERPPIAQLKIEVSESNYTVVGKKYGVNRSTIRRWINSDK